MVANKKTTYRVISNPCPDSSELLVLFTGHSQTKPMHRLGPKVFDYWLIHYVESGFGTFTCEGKTYSLRRGDSFIIFPGVLVSYESDRQSPWAYRWIAFKGEAVERLMAATGFSLSMPTVRSERSGIGGWFERVKKVFQEKPSGVNLWASGYLQLLLAEYAEAIHSSMEHDAWENGNDDDIGASDMKGSGVTLARQAIHYLSMQYAEPVTIENMAESLGYNRAYLSRVFRQHTGVNPVTFLLQLRLDRARRLLRERLELTIEQVASSVGFQDALYFSKQFRRKYGESPSEYRLSVRKYQTL